MSRGVTTLHPRQPSKSQSRPKGNDDVHRELMTPFAQDGRVRARECAPLGSHSAVLFLPERRHAFRVTITLAVDQTISFLEGQRLGGAARGRRANDGGEGAVHSTFPVTN